MITKAIGKALKEFREKKEYTTNYISLNTRIPRVTIEKIESGKNYNIESLERYIKFLLYGYDIDTLKEQSKNMPNHAKISKLLEEIEENENIYREAAEQMIDFLKERIINKRD